MNRDDFEQLYRSADNKLYEFYRAVLYRMGEHPSIFWCLVAFAVVGVVTVARWVL